MNRVYNLFVNIAMFFNTFAIPTLLEKISWKVFFLYIGWNALAVGVMWALSDTPSGLLNWRETTY